MSNEIRNIEVVAYRKEWKVQFERLQDYLDSLLHEYVRSIEHVGSTSVEGCYAKPIVDLDLVLYSLADFEKVKKILQKAGFEHRGDLGIPGRESFRNLFPDDFGEYHLYVCDPFSRKFLEHIALREYLRTHEDARDRYSALKLQLAKAYPHDIDSYIDGKSQLIEGILATVEAIQTMDEWRRKTSYQR